MHGMLELITHRTECDKRKEGRTAGDGARLENGSHSHVGHLRTTVRGGELFVMTIMVCLKLDFQPSLDDSL